MPMVYGIPAYQVAAANQEVVIEDAAQIVPLVEI